ncbi:MAG: TatD family hydrolase [Bacteroidales bacterium]|nr:TatD family hydrolase [Bacteroidales bacterium]
MFVDTHTHFYDQWLLPDAEAAIQRALEAGVGKMIQADIDSHERPAMWALGRKHPGVLYQMLGLYPGSVNADWKEELDQVYRLAAGDARSVPGMTERPNEAPRSEATQGVWGIRPPGSETDLKPMAVNAIGEIGLDYHEGKEFAKEQKEVLRLQFELAAKLDLPVNIHLRDAWEDFFAVLEDSRHLHLRGNLHCFSGSYEVYERARRSGDFSVGIGGVLTFKNSGLPAAVARIPMEHILLETDAPYLAPTPYRGKRNESAYLPLIAAKLAEVKGLSLNDIETITTDNAIRLFNL